MPHNTFAMHWRRISLLRGKGMHARTRRPLPPPSEAVWKLALSNSTARINVRKRRDGKTGGRTDGHRIDVLRLPLDAASVTSGQNNLA